MTLPRVLTRATNADIENLVSEKATEGPHLEFKRNLPGNDNSSKHELIADISAMANSSGGDVIYGINEDGEGCAAEVIPQVGIADTEARRIQDILKNLVEPRIPGLQVQPVAVTGGFVLVVRVPQSWAGPHRVKTNQHFYFREGGRKRELDIPEIRGLFLRSENQAQRVRDFRSERIGKILAGEAPHSLISGPLMIVHLIPTQAALGLMQVDPVFYTDERTLTTLGTSVHHTRLNVDGALGIRKPQPGGTHGYALFFRNGFFEAVKVLTGKTKSGQYRLPSPGYEEDIIKLVKQFRVELAHLGVGPEMTCMFTLTDAQSVELGFEREGRELEDYQGQFDRQTLVLPDVLLPADKLLDHALRPLFDLVWQSAGLLGSPSYNASGDWAPRR